jgi:hypothetical protein
MQLRCEISRWSGHNGCRRIEIAPNPLGLSHPMLLQGADAL